MPNKDLWCPKCGVDKSPPEEFYIPLGEISPDGLYYQYTCKECSGPRESYFGNWGKSVPGEVKVGDKLIDLMNTSSFERDHQRPHEWFHEQTRLKREKRAAEDRDRYIKNGTLAEVNRRRKSVGLDPL